MRTRKFRTLRGWLDYLSANHGPNPGARVYEALNEFFRDEMHVMYFTGIGTANEKYQHDRVSLPWDQKLAVAQKIVDFHWRPRTKGERLRIAESLAKGYGDLSMLQTFIVELRKNGGKWEYNFCTCCLSGPSYDWCKRQYLRSI